MLTEKPIQMQNRKLAKAQQRLSGHDKYENKKGGQRRRCSKKRKTVPKAAADSVRQLKTFKQTLLQNPCNKIEMSFQNFITLISCLASKFGKVNLFSYILSKRTQLDEMHYHIMIKQGKRVPLLPALQTPKNIHKEEMIIA